MCLSAWCKRVARARGVSREFGAARSAALICFNLRTRQLTKSCSNFPPPGSCSVFSSSSSSPAANKTSCFHTVSTSSITSHRSQLLISCPANKYPLNEASPLHTHTHTHTHRDGGCSMTGGLWHINVIRSNRLTGFIN